jgi:hypothetical protein
MATKHEKLRAMLDSHQQAQLDQVMAALEKDPQALEHHREKKGEKRIQNRKSSKLPEESHYDGDERILDSRDGQQRYADACALAEEAIRQANGAQITKKGS